MIDVPQIYARVMKQTKYVLLIYFVIEIIYFSWTFIKGEKDMPMFRFPHIILCTLPVYHLIVYFYVMHQIRKCHNSNQK